MLLLPGCTRLQRRNGISKSFFFVGAPGAFAPSDFVNEHETLAEAVADVLDYYFGDESRMNPPELANIEQLRENGKYRGW